MEAGVFVRSGPAIQRPVTFPGIRYFASATDRRVSMQAGEQRRIQHTSSAPPVNRAGRPRSRKPPGKAAVFCKDGGIRFKNGVFRPTEKVDLPEGTTVRVEPEAASRLIRDMDFTRGLAGSAGIVDHISQLRLRYCDRRYSSGPAGGRGAFSSSAVGSRIV
jgi:predicted DNA-binding antitoxin AbrB/MazE fold protein